MTTDPESLEAAMKVASTRTWNWSINPFAPEPNILYSITDREGALLVIRVGSDGVLHIEGASAGPVTVTQMPIEKQPGWVGHPLTVQAIGIEPGSQVAKFIVDSEEI